MSERIDVSIEHRHAPPEDGGRPHPNTCPKCGSHYRDDELAEHLNVCPQCGHHFPVHAYERIQQLVDADSFVEEAAELRSDDPLEFFDLRPYTERLAEAELSTGLGEAMVIGHAAIEDEPCQLSVMEFGFMGGSMGRVVGEKFARACEGAAERGVPLVSVTTTGVAQVLDRAHRLRQLHQRQDPLLHARAAGGTLISVMAHPTTAGVLASFASLGDVLVAEPGALLSFTGPRVVQQTTREKLPEDFGLAESNYRYGHIDAIVPRPELRPTLGRLLRLFADGR